MSVVHVDSGVVPARVTGRRRNENDASGLFDLIHARLQLPEMPTEATVLAKSVPAAPPAKPEPSTPPQPAPAPEKISTQGPVMSRLDPTPPVVRLDDGAVAVRHGTLPVIVSGQLVELTVFRERRVARDAAPVRRLSLVLETAVSGDVRIEARVHDDCLFVEMTGDGAGDVEARARYADEIRELASRLGWTFSTTTWEIAT